LEGGVDEVIDLQLGGRRLPVDVDKTFYCEDLGRCEVAFVELFVNFVPQFFGIQNGFFQEQLQKFGKTCKLYQDDVVQAARVEPVVLVLVLDGIGGSVTHVVNIVDDIRQLFMVDGEVIGLVVRVQNGLDQGQELLAF